MSSSDAPKVFVFPKWSFFCVQCGRCKKHTGSWQCTYCRGDERNEILDALDRIRAGGTTVER